MTARFLNEGATLVIETETQRVFLESQEDNQELLLELFKLVNAANPR